MKIKELESSFKELQKYSDAQFQTVNELQKEIDRLNSENRSLKQMLEGSLPSLGFRPGQLGISNEQLICETQIFILKERATKGELNADEVRRFASLFEVLEKIKKAAQYTPDASIQKMSDAEILQLVTSDGTTK